MEKYHSVHYLQKLQKIYKIDIKFQLWDRKPRPPNFCPNTVYMCR